MALTTDRSLTLFLYPPVHLGSEILVVYFSFCSVIFRATETLLTKLNSIHLPRFFIRPWCYSAFLSSFRCFCQIIPAVSNPYDVATSKGTRESGSLDLDSQIRLGGGLRPGSGTPGQMNADDSLRESPKEDDLFGAFSSVTLHHDGDT